MAKYVYFDNNQKAIPLEVDIYSITADTIRVHWLPSSDDITILTYKGTDPDQSYPADGSTYSYKGASNETGYIKIDIGYNTDSSGDASIAVSAYDTMDSFKSGQSYKDTLTESFITFLLHGKYGETDYFAIYHGTSEEFLTTVTPDEDGVIKGLAHPIKEVLADIPVKAFIGDTIKPYIVYSVGSDVIPYEPLGYSSEGGGDGSYNFSSDLIGASTPESTMSQIFPYSTGMASLFVATAAQIGTLAAAMWTDDFVTNVYKLFNDPADVIIAINAFPIRPITFETKALKVGNVAFPGVTMSELIASAQHFDFGTIKIEPFYDAVWDYSPHTKIQIYLPFIGFRDLDPDEVMGSTLGIRYNIDFFSGTCVAEITVNGNVFYSFNGNVAAPLPISGRSYSEMYSSLVFAATQVGIGIATGGAGAAIGGVGAARSLASSLKPNYSHSGSMSGNAGYLGGQTPYIIYNIPQANVPEKNKSYSGYPSNIYEDLSTITGYTEIEDIHPEGFTATSDELDELISLLKGGIIL